MSADSATLPFSGGERPRDDAPPASAPDAVAALPVAGSTERRPKLYGLQMLRFFAAALVLYAHAGDRLEALGERYHLTVSVVPVSGRLGVDIFFVMSGFIMGFLALEKFGRANTPLPFAIDRLTRVAPLYWIMTLVGALFAVVSLKLGDASSTEPVTFASLTKSLFFVPYLNAADKQRPILSQGWTLNYEMLFYLVFTLCLCWRRPWGPLALLGSFIAIYAAGFWSGAPVFLRLWSDPIIFEFLIGFGLAVVKSRQSRLPPIGGSLALMLAILVGATLATSFASPGLLFNTGVATLLVALCTLGPDIAPDHPVKRALVSFGDWSYSLYLVHGIVMTVVIFVWRKVLGPHHLGVLAALLAVAALGAAGVVHHAIERPSTALCRRALRWLAGTAGRPVKVSAP